MYQKIFYFLLTSLLTTTAYSKSIKVETKAYTGTVDIYTPKEQLKEIAVIILHGKVRGRKHSGNRRVARKLAKAGYLVYAPEMPYNGYIATLKDGFRLLDAIIKIANQKHQKIIVMGHSMGATVAFLYTVAHQHPKSVIGVVMLAPGHVLHQSSSIQEGTALDVQTARRTVKSGKGKSRNQFRDVNQDKRFTITTSAKIYLSYFDPAIFSNLTTLLNDSKLPVLWLDGNSDVMAAQMGYANLYLRLAKHKNNLYKTVRGGHVDMMSRTPKVIVSWLEKL